MTSPTTSPGCDPRTKILLVVAVSTAVMGTGGLRLVPGALVLAVGLALAEGAWRRAVVLPAAVGVMWVLGWLLPSWWASPFTAVLSLACTYLVRFTVAAGVGMHLFATTSPGALSAALHASRIPRAITVTLTVMLRFFPMVAGEASAVRDAMRLRGLTGGWGLVRRPILSVERFVVPMIASSLRAAEDLSVSAILRGLGSRHTPTAMRPPCLGPADGVLLAAVGTITAATLLLPAPLT